MYRILIQRIDGVKDSGGYEKTTNVYQQDFTKLDVNAVVTTAQQAEAAVAQQQPS